MLEAPPAHARPSAGAGLRWLELGLVVLVALGGSLSHDLADLAARYGLLRPDQVWWWGAADANFLHEVLSLALLGYVLTRRGWGPRDIGLGFAWADVPASLALLVVSRGAGACVYHALYVLFWNTDPTFHASPAAFLRLMWSAHWGGWDWRLPLWLAYATVGSYSTRAM